MKILKRPMTIGICLTLVFFSMAMISCKKAKIRKNISGVWTLQSATIDGNPYPGQVSGTYEFGSCSASNNRKESCTLHQKLTFNYMGSTNAQDTIISYKVLKKGERIRIGGSDEMEVDLNDNQLQLTASDNSETVVLTFTK